MNQSSAIAASMILAFIVFVTVRGELPCYMTVLGIANDGSCPIGNPGGVATATGGSSFLPGGTSGGAPTIGACTVVNGIQVCGSNNGTGRINLPPVTIGGGSGGPGVTIGGGSIGF